LTYLANDLNAGQIERLVMIAEECVEVAMECCKTLRHGLNSYHPADPNKTPNRERIVKEYIDLLAVLTVANVAGDIELPDGGIARPGIAAALRKKEEYTHHQGELFHSVATVLDKSRIEFQYVPAGVQK
jgi:hypothetical protein